MSRLDAFANDFGSLVGLAIYVLSLVLLTAAAVVAYLDVQAGDPEAMAAMEHVGNAPGYAPVMTMLASGALCALGIAIMISRERTFQGGMSA